MTPTDSNLPVDHERALEAKPHSRASMLGSVAMGAMLAAAASPVAAQVVNSTGAQLSVNGTDILNFALNLEYLEAEYEVTACALRASRYRMMPS